MADMALQGAALKAAAMGAGTAVKVEAVSPVDKSAMNKAFRSEPCSMVRGLPLPFTSLLAMLPLPQLPWALLQQGLDTHVVTVALLLQSAQNHPRLLQQTCSRQGEGPRGCSKWQAWQGGGDQRA